MIDRLTARIDRARFAATPLYARRTQIRRALGRTAVGGRAKTMRRFVVGRRARAPIELPTLRPPRPTGQNVLFISHCDFSGNSAYHVYAIATELERRGWSPAIAVPDRPRGVRDLGRPSFPVYSFRDVRHGRLAFPDGSGPDVIHAWTPRESVRRLTVELVGRYRCPYVVHLEDNELAVGAAVVTAYDPQAVDVFLAGAAGVTAVIARLLELKPDDVPGAAFWPGYDELLDRPGRPRDDVRRDVGIRPDEIAVAYTGNVHEANAEEVRSLYEAVASLRAEGKRVVLVKSGWNSVPASRLPSLGDGIRNVGWIKRHRVIELLRAADVLVQPGAPGPFNDYRFPSKLPDFLASGAPVVLPASNIGLHLGSDEAVILAHGDARELATAMRRLIDEPDVARQIGAAGQAFAHERLTWSRAVTEVEAVYFNVTIRRSATSDEEAEEHE